MNNFLQIGLIKSCCCCCWKTKSLRKFGMTAKRTHFISIKCEKNSFTSLGHYPKLPTTNSSSMSEQIFHVSSKIVILSRERGDGKLGKISKKNILIILLSQENFQGRRTSQTNICMVFSKSQYKTIEIFLVLNLIKFKNTFSSFFSLFFFLRKVHKDIFFISLPISTLFLTSQWLLMQMLLLTSVKWCCRLKKRRE